MTSLFQGSSARSPSPIPSEGGLETDTKPVDTVKGKPAVSGAGEARPEGSTTSIPYGGVYRKEEGGVTLKGRGPLVHDPRKFRYDVVRGRGAARNFEVSREDRLSADQAGEMLHRLHVVFGVDRENPDLLDAFDRGLFFCHTVNSGSTVTPGRGDFSIPGVTQKFTYAAVRDVLGTDMRRFFRAYADEITTVNREVLKKYDPYDVVSAEKWGWLQQVAFDRGMQRHPHLSHDSADACLQLDPSERAALASSKVSVLARVQNAPDRLNANSRVSTADGYNSTIGQGNVSNGN